MSNREDAARVIRQEHEEIKELLRRIAETKDMESLLPQLEALRRLLAVHFEHEEAPSGLASAADEPRLAAQAERIFEEHGLFLSTMDDLVRQIRASLDGHRDVLRGVTALVRQLHDHEGRENALMLDMADTDLGGLG